MQHLILLYKIQYIVTQNTHSTIREKPDILGFIIEINFDREPKLL